jgi:GAF domain-containing protein
MRTRASFDKAVRQVIEPNELMRRIADQALAFIEASDGVLVGLCEDGGEFLTNVCGNGRLVPFVGTRVSMRHSLSGLAIRQRQVLRTDDTRSDPRVDSEAADRAGVRSSICVPLHLDDRPIGVLNVSSAQPLAFDDSDVSVLADLADFMSVVIGAALDLEKVTKALLNSARPLRSKPPRFQAGRSRESRVEGSNFVANVLSPGFAQGMNSRRSIESVLEQRSFSTVFQPVFDLCDGRLLAVEALTRFHVQPVRPPDAWFS